uniref:FAD/NAD(P)-binding domain-containing protein n=1 Tax=viral metagenome TaxID=1070528 RepID=A0A6C0AW32_9ZZZZ
MFNIINMEKKKKIIVVGFGWGSVNFLKYIDTDIYDVQIISKNKSFIYTPLLARNIKDNRNLELDINDINNKISLIENEVKNIEFDNNKVIISNNTVNYDYLILSHGSSVNTFNISGVKENCYFLKSNDDATNLRNLLLNLPKGANIAVIGCGLTGSEIVGTLIDYNKFKISAIDAVPRPLTMFNSKLSDFTTNIWNLNKVNLYMNHMVSKITKDTIYFKNNNKINYDLSIWCGGIKLSPLTKIIMETLNMENNKGIEINDMLKVKNTKNVWAIGDCAYSGNPPTAQVAYQQGYYLAKQFNSGFTNKNEFHFKNKGQIGYIGNKNSIYQNNYFTASGNLVYYLNTFIHMYNSVTYKQMYNLFNDKK